MGYVEEVMSDAKLSDAQKAERSRLETFAGFRFVSEEFWPDTQFVVYSGKNLPERTSGIWVVSNKTKSRFAGDPVHNELFIELGPDPGMELLSNFKRPGSRLIMSKGSMKLDPRALGGHELDGYGMLWNHAFRGLDYLFPTSGAIEAAAELCEPVIQYWRNSDEDMDDYPVDLWPETLEAKLGHCSLVDYSKSRE
jgi:glucose-6-phosphate 1-dehydrogenase